MFIQNAMKMYIESDLLSSRADDDSLAETEILDDDYEDFEQIRTRLLKDLEPDDEWCTPLMKISKLSSEDESWMDAKVIIDPPNARCHKIGDEV